MLSSIKAYTLLVACILLETLDYNLPPIDSGLTANNTAPGPIRRFSYILLINKLAVESIKIRTIT